MKKFVPLVIVLCSVWFDAKAETTIYCRTHYLYQVYHPPVPPVYYEGDQVGRIPIAGTGSPAYYENVWSSMYQIDVQFFSGYELRTNYYNYDYADSSIVAKVNWSNGGWTYIQIENWYTKLKVMTRDEILYDPYGNLIPKCTGYDSTGRFWEFYL